VGPAIGGTGAAGPYAARSVSAISCRGAAAYEPLKALARFFCGDDLDVEAQLILKREEAPRFTLESEDTPPPRLGWVSWMFTRPLDRDPDETILRLWDE
jgi:type VI secretion system protein ImpH